MKCPHCDFIKKTFGRILKKSDSTNREYWLMTEVFLYLHGTDVCPLDNEKICIDCGCPIPEYQIGDGEYCKGKRCIDCVNNICKLCCDSDYERYEDRD